MIMVEKPKWTKFQQETKPSYERKKKRKLLTASFLADQQEGE